MDNTTWSAITAIVAIVAPVISTIINVRSNEQTRRMELYSPRVYDAVKRMTDNYSAFCRQQECMTDRYSSRTDAVWRFTQDYKKFLSSCYEVMSLIPDEKLHTLFLDFLCDLETRTAVTQEQDKAFHEISAAIADILKKGKSHRFKMKNHNRAEKRKSTA